MQRRHHLNVAREAALLTRLRALRVPGVVRLLGAREGAEQVFLAFEACEGGDLLGGPPARAAARACAGGGGGGGGLGLGLAGGGGAKCGSGGGARGANGGPAAAAGGGPGPGPGPGPGLGALIGEAELCRRVVAPLLRVLADLHALGIVHRDVK